MATVLAIDDELAILKYLKMILAELGYDARIACNGLDGCNEAKNPDVKLIISDLNMAGEISGINLVKKLRALRPDCPIIILTGYPTGERLKEAEELNVEFLTKPFEMPFLATLLKRLLPLDAASDSKPIALK
ncbi:MAG: response regulator [Verrucomicrobia bacterium]|nr:response regulator [Verrucomicrobiota bacterium]MBU1734735.1 response regulator [Verrucomicrobiota bacterium]MBU1857753.1 response regulator [Verrucomicrobiota bacterium]